MSQSLIWVNDDSTVLITSYEDSYSGLVMYVATRDQPDHTWGPPVACKADRATVEILARKGNVTA